MKTGGKSVNGKYPVEAFKVKVIQEFEVYLYFQEGIVAEDDEDKYDIIVEEAMNAAFGEDGLTAVLHEQTESSNGYLAYVTTFEPNAEVVYNMDHMPEVMAQSLKEKGFVND